MSTLLSLSRREALVGLDVGDCHIAASQARPLPDGGVRVSHLALAEYDSSASDREIARAIRGVWRKFGIPVYTVCSCLRSQSLILKYFRYPKLSPQELRSAVRLEAEESLQLPLEELVVDVHVNRISGEEDGQTDEGGVEGVLVAVPRDAVERHVNILDMAGLYPVIVDAGALAVSNLFVQMKNRLVRGAVCVVNLSTRSADIAILFERDCVYPRTVVSRSGGWEDAVDYLITNIKDGIKYYQFKLRNELVENVILTGQVPKTEEFLSRMRTEIGLPVELWDPMGEVAVAARKRARILRESGDSSGSLMTTCLGLALRGES